MRVSGPSELLYHTETPNSLWILRLPECEEVEMMIFRASE